MAAQPGDVVDALIAALPSDFSVRLDEVNGRPHAVIDGPGVAETWVDLRASIGGDESADASSVASSVIGYEGWPRR